MELHIRPVDWCAWGRKVVRPVSASPDQPRRPHAACAVAAATLALAGLTGCLASATHSSTVPIDATAAPAQGGPAATSRARVRLLSEDQYYNSIGYIFGPDITLAAHFAPFRRTQGLLEIGASSAGVTTGQSEDFQHTAAVLADEVVTPGHRGFLIPCIPKDAKRPDDKCARQFLSAVGRLLYRRPLRTAELTKIVAKANEGASRMGDFYFGLSAALEGMLISPNF